MALAGASIASGQATGGPVTPRLRVAVMDLTGSALKMQQMTQTPAPRDVDTLMERHLAISERWAQQLCERR